MAFQVLYKIPFRSFNGTDFVVNIYKDAVLPAGYPLTLEGAADTFITEEMQDDDMFMPIRRQTGTLRILDRGKALKADGVTEVDFDWRELTPANDLDTPITLTSGTNNIIHWQGFIQSQTYGHVLYGNPQVLEFPVQCCLSVLQARQVSTSETLLRNFAYLVKYAIDNIPEFYGSGEHVITNLIIQGDTDAKQWLMKQVDWQNFISTDDDGDKPRYDIYGVLEDLCRFWGWTARTKGRTLYLMCADDAAEQTFVSLTYSGLAFLANGTDAGSHDAWSTVELSGNIFANIDNEDRIVRGYNKATVSADCNEADNIMQFAPKVVRDILDAAGSYTWTGEGMVGYFSTPIVRQFATNVLDGITGLSGGFCRRQIYTADDSTEPDMCDMIVLNSSGGSRAQVQLERKRSAMFAPGTLKISGTVYNGAKLEDDLTESWLKLWTMDMRIGIGETRQTAKWFYFNYSLADGVEIGWSDTAQTFKVYVVNGTIKGLVAIHAQLYAKYISAIPIDAGMYGHLFIDIEGNQGTDFELANLEIGYSRDRVVVQQGAPQTRSLTVARVSHHDYVSVSSGKVENNWNADCIFASDNNMNYGYGLIMNPTDKNYMQTAGYGASDEHPEQHLANRVTAFWQTARRETKVELLRNVAGLVTPKHKVTIDGTQFYPFSISNNWRDDIVIISLIQI